MRGGRGVYSAGSWTWIFAPEPSISAVCSIGACFFFFLPSGRFGYASMSSPWLTRTVNGTGHTGPSEFCATSI